MSSTEEYQQQQFNNMVELGNSYVKMMDEFRKAFYDDVILGESYLHVTKNDIRRIHPLSEEAESIKNKLTNGK